MIALEIAGIINGTAPNPVKLSEMCEQLGQVVSRPSWLPVPEFALKAVLGEGASVVSILQFVYIFFLPLMVSRLWHLLSIPGS